MSEQSKIGEEHGGVRIIQATGSEGVNAHVHAHQLGILNAQARMYTHACDNVWIDA